jgi:hypothetical protein
MASNPEWESQFQAYRSEFAAKGVFLLQLLQADPVLFSGFQDDPNCQLAISTALEERPELVQGQAGDQLIKSFFEVGITEDHPLAISLVTAYLNENVIMAADEIDLNDRDALEDLRNQIDAALKDNSDLAALTGIEQHELNAIADILIELSPGSSSEDHTDSTGSLSFDSANYINRIAAATNSTISKIEGLAGGHYSNIFTGAGVALALPAMIDSSADFIKDPSVKTFLTAASKDIPALNDSLALAMNFADKKPDWFTTLGRASSCFKFIGAAIALDGSRNRLAHGDEVGAALNMGVAGSSAISIYAGLTGAATMAAWWTGVGLLLTASLAGWDRYNHIQATNTYMTETTAEFFSYAGFNETAAQALSDQSGEGHSPVPIFMRYGELKGMTKQETVEWINTIVDSENGLTKLEWLRDCLHRTQDAIDNDISQFNSFDESDDHMIDNIHLGIDNIEGEGPGHSVISASTWADPRSAAQVDALLAKIGIEVPVLEQEAYLSYN